MTPLKKNSGISPVNLHGGLGTTLTQRALLEHQWQAGLLAAARRTEESAKCNESQVSFLRHCPVSETGGLLTMRCSDSEGLGKPGEEFRCGTSNGRPQAEGAGLHPSPLFPGMSAAVAVVASRAQMEQQLNCTARRMLRR